MPCRNREAYNTRRREKYHSETDFRLKENNRTRRHQQRVREAEKVAALPHISVANFARTIGLSRHQVATLARRNIIPSYTDGGGGWGQGRQKTVTIDQIFWTIVGLFVSKRREHWCSSYVRRAFDLDRFKIFLHAVWEKPFPLRRDTEALLVHAAEELASREVLANTPYELRRLSTFLNTLNNRG